VIVHRFGTLDAEQISGITPASARASSELLISPSNFSRSVKTE
jgi:hypothetical protein